ncbi:hypothetical protein GGR28_000718 [Lewinella aquimaris]|uniref:Uncharacterized protein n=1 Tax=Neolewinella aquimaris TaxID=1835722 RepID=A0A840E4S3_9BACT|nr:hypothetical protein [Neolewinella aquimaris]MBB4078117.1 hypothetical protein [Neolewinella aquimaris]
MKWILFLFPLWLGAQQSRVFDADFRFSEGIYLSQDALLANTPDVSWSQITGEMVQLAEDYRLQVAGFGYKDRSYRTPYAISLDGQPYLFIRADEERGFHEFAGLRERGTYSTLRYDTLVHTRQLMRAYNPATGFPFREGWVERDRTRSLSRIFELTSGRRLPLDLPTVMRLVASESDLVAALERTGPEEQDKLIRALRIYNERHPLLLPRPQANR